MKVAVKVRFNASKERLEKFGNNKYLMYLPFEQDEESSTILRELLSRQLGAPVQRIEFIGIDASKDWIFELH